MPAQLENYADTRRVSPKDLAAAKLRYREPKLHGDELYRLDAEMIAAHETKEISMKARDAVVSLNYLEQARCHIRRAKQIHAFMKKAGCRVNQSELDALEMFVG